MPSFVAANTYSATTSATSFSIAYPTGTVGDVFLLFAITGSGSGVLSASGFTSLSGDIGNSMDCNAFYRVATGTEGSNATVTLSPTYSSVIVLARYTDVLTTGTPYHGTGNNVTTTAATTSPAQATLTGTVATDLVVAAYMAQDSAQGSAVVSFSGSGWTTRASAAHVSGGGGLDTCAILLADKFGATDHPTATTSPTTQWGVVNLSLIDLPATVKTPAQQSNIIARRRASNF